jgi:tetratricopeptide (TPR) repeat protein
MWRLFLLVCSVLVLLLWLMVLARAQGFGDKMEYRACLKQAREQPRETLVKADAWARAGGGLPAEHCTALALLYAGQVAQAATRLDALAARATSFVPTLRAELYAQAGSAWLAAGNAEKALAAQNNAVQLDPQNAENWIDRSITLAGVGAYKEAAEDLSTALKLTPRRPEILILRAAAYRNLQDWKRARTDADAALAYDPNNPEALVERAYVRLATGDRKGADADFRQALSFAQPGSDVAKEAQAGLAQAAAPAPAPPAAPPRRR